MDVKVITISREFGSGGRTVGRCLAQLLGVPYYDKDLVRKVAEQTGLDESYVAEQEDHARPWGSLLSYAFSGFGGHTMGGLSADDWLWVSQSRVIEELADQGPCILVGRCADYILRHRKDGFHVFLHAPIQERAERIVRLYGASEAEPEQRLEEKDSRRRTYYKHYTGREWGMSQNYHLSLDTSVLGVEGTARLIAQVVGRG
ncbi:MAG TPA: cytidylate kinase [Clostridiales bacterium]|nr:cytidylate kinase [Clostridiales bacterium]